MTSHYGSNAWVGEKSFANEKLFEVYGILQYKIMRELDEAEQGKITPVCFEITRLQRDPEDIGYLNAKFYLKEFTVELFFLTHYTVRLVGVGQSMKWYENGRPCHMPWIAEEKGKRLFPLLMASYGFGGWTAKVPVMWRALALLKENNPKMCGGCLWSKANCKCADNKPLVVSRTITKV